MDEEPVVVASALRHGLTEEEILHAFSHAIAVLPGPWRGLEMWIGPVPSGALVEIGLNQWHTTTAIVHAMQARHAVLRAGGLMR